METLGFGAFGSETLKSYMIRIFAWMFAALSITGAVAWFINSTPALADVVFNNTLLFFTILALELVAVLVLTSIVEKLSPGAAALIFICYSVMNGITLAGIFSFFTGESIAMACLITAAMFGMMSLYGFFTGRDLSGWGNLLFAGLVGVIIAAFVNFFLKSNLLTWISSLVGVAIFAGLVAFDTRKIRDLYDRTGTTQSTKYAITGALALYLDFINIFLYLIRLLGKRRTNW